MARNKITFEKEYDEISKRNSYFFTGSQRQPTINEILDFVKDTRLEDEIDDYFLVVAINPRADRDSGFLDDSEDKTVEFWGYNGGSGEFDSSCPICGHERDMGGDKCPICDKPW